MRKLPSQREVAESLQDAERQRRIHDPYTPHGLENYRSFSDRFTAAVDRGDAAYKAGRYAEAAKDYGRALIFGRISRITGFASACPSKSYIVAVKKKKQEALRKAGEGKNDGGLEKTSATTTIIGFLGAIFFLSGNLTGNVIGSLNQTSSNWLGGILFMIGLVGAFVYFRRR